MKTSLTFFAIILFSGSLFGQKFVQEWYIELPGLEYYSQATAILSTQDDNLLIAGPNNSSSSSGFLFFMKTDTAGNVVWMTSSEEQYNSTGQIANSLIEDKDTNLIMVGNYAYGYTNNTYFTKLSPAGDVINTHVNGAEHGYQGGYDVEQTLDGGYLVTGKNFIYGTGISLALRKLNSTGQFIWDTTLVHPDGVTPIVGIFSGMDKIDDSTFVITGKRNYAPGSGEDLDVLLCKVRVWDDSVKILNLTVFEKDGTNEQGSDILILPDDQGYIICGTGENEDVTGYTDGIIMRTDTAGNLVWKKSYTRALYSNTVFLRVLLDDEENLLVLAQTQAASSDVSLLKYSLDGDLLQKQHFDLNLNEIAYDMAISQHGKIFISAGTWSLSATSSLLLKVKDICPVTTPDAWLENEQPVLGEDVTVHIQNTNDAWSYGLLQINGEVTLGTYMGNGETLDFTAGGLNNDDVSQGLVVSVIEPDVDCIKYSDTLFPEFICPVETPEVSLINPTPNIGEDLVVRVLNTHDAWEYHLIQINGEVTLSTTTGNGGTYDFNASGLTNDDVSGGLVVSAGLPGFDECIEYSDTLYPEFIDGIEDRYQKSLQIAPNPFHNFITITDTENNKLSRLAVFNTKGQLIFDKAIATDRQKIILSHVPKGIYFIRVTYREGTSVFRKIVKN